MFKFGITVPGARFDCSPVEGVFSAAEVGVDGVELYDPLEVDFDEVRQAESEAGIEVFGTIAVGGGGNLEDYDAPAMVRPDDHDQVVADLERSIDMAADLDCTTLAVTVGPDQPDLSSPSQHNSIVRCLRAVAPAAESKGVTLVIEPLNNRVDHPNYYLTSSDEGTTIVEAVDSPNVKLLFDIYHQQITEGDVTRRLREYIEYVGHIHVADAPGRHQPGIGELNYENIFATIGDLGYDAYVSCELDPIGDSYDVFQDLVAMADAARK